VTTTYTQARLSVSASKLKDFARCERSWYLSAVARAPDDDSAGGKYLVQGDLFDEAVGRYSARMDVDVEADLVPAVKAKPGLRGAALSLAEEDWAVMGERAQRMLRAVQHLLPAPKTAKVQHRYRLPVVGYDDRGGVVVSGATDLRLPGLVWDTKSTADRGPGRGRDAKTPPYALTDATLRDDYQARLYAWCEFQLNADLQFCRCVWVYASKPNTGAPQGWSVETTFARGDTLAWFDDTIRPQIDRMLDLEADSEFELAPENARANHDGCARCFRRAACNPFAGAQHQYPEGTPGTMTIDFAALRARQAAKGAKPTVSPLPAPGPSLEDALRASLTSVSPAREDAYAALVADAAAVCTGLPVAGTLDVAAVAINRPDAPPNPNHPASPGYVAPAEAVSVVRLDLPVLDVAGEEAPVVADAPPPAVAEPPKKTRGRPRKPAATAAEPAEPAALRSAPDLAERVERIASAAQTVVDECNTLLRGWGLL
jgi:hypothetical protein